MGTMPCPDAPEFSPQLVALRALREAHEAVAALLEFRLREHHGIGVSDLELLFALQRGGGRMRMVDIADANGISRSGVTQTVDRLEKLGYVTRESAPSDRRSTLAAITAAGRAAFLTAHEQCETVASEILTAHTERDVTRIHRGLTRLTQSACEARSSNAR